MIRRTALNGREAVTYVLMAASAAGTLYVFSLGEVALPHFFETSVTAGGVALATDAVVAICARTLGTIDTRIAHLQKRMRGASKRETADLTAQQAMLNQRKRQTFQSFLGACAISATANTIFHYQTQQNIALALFLGVIPSVLAYVLNAVLRPLPRDYEDEAKAATKEAIIGVVELAADTVRTHSRRRDLRQEDKERLAAAYTALATYGDEREIHNLRQMSSTMGVTVAEEVVDAPDTQTLLTAEAIAQSWGVSLRTAQGWMTGIPEAKKLAGMWMAPEVAILKRHPRTLQLASPRRVRKRSDANGMQENETSMQTSEAPAQDEREEMQEAS